MDKISGILGLSGINAAGNNFALEALASAPANDSISFSGSEAINAFGVVNVASLEDEEAVGSENNEGAEGAEGADNAEAAQKTDKAANEEIAAQENAENADTEAAEDAKKADDTKKAQTAAQAKAKAAAEKLDVSNKKVADADAKVSAAEAELDRIEADGEIEGKEANTKDTLDALKAEMEDIKREQETKLKEREELENKQNQLVEDLAEAQADGNKEKIQELGGELNGVNQKLDGVQNDLESLSSRRDNLQNNIDSTQRQLEQEQQAKAQAQQDKANAANEAKQDAAGEAAQAHQEQQSAAQEANQANQTAQQADQQATQAQSTADASKAQADQAKSAAETAKAQAQAARADAQAKEAEAAQADAEVASAESALAAAQSATKTVTNEDGTTSEVPDEAAISAAQAQLDAATAAAEAAHAAADEAAATADQLEAESGVAEQEASQAQTEATADAAEAKEAGAEAKEADSAAQEAAAGSEAADSAAQAADKTNDRAENVADKAEADNSAVQSAAENSGAKGSDGAASGSGGSGGSGASGAGETGGAGSGAAAETGSAGSSERAAEAVKEAEASANSAVNKANDLDFSECADGDVASGIDSYCEAKGYDVPEGFGETLVEYAKENDVDPAVALAICEENNFGADGNGMMGLSSAENQKQEANSEGGIFSKIADKISEAFNGGPKTDDAWKEELSAGMAEFAAKREAAGCSSKDSVEAQLEAVGKSGWGGVSDASKWAEAVGDKYTQDISPYMLDNVKGCETQLGSNISSALEAALAMEGMTETGDTEAINALINEYDPSWPLDCSTTPWCAAFASSILNEYGVMDFSNCENTNYCPSLQSWAEGEGTWRANDGSYTPSAGSMVLFNWDGGDVDHVGIVTGYDPDTDTLYTVEGNTSDAVHQRTYSPASSMSEVAGYIEPNGANAEKAGEAASSAANAGDGLKWDDEHTGNVGDAVRAEMAKESSETGTVSEIASRIAEAIESAKGASDSTAVASAIESALAMEGMTETGDTEAINALINEYDPSWPLDCSTTPWCAAFASSVLNEYGVMDFSNCENANYCPSLQSWAEGEGTWRVNDGSYTPEAGSMVLFNWDGGETDHVGIVTGYDPDTDTLYTVEGNTSDAVHQRSYSPASSMSEVAGYIEPNGPNAPKAGEAAASGTVGEIASRIAEAIESAKGASDSTAVASAIESALAMEGMTETGDTEAINALINEYDPSWPLDCSTTPWCAAFASSVLNEYGVMDFSNCENTNYCPSLQSWAEGEGTWRVNDGSYTPEAGSMVLFNWDGGEVDHVGIVTGYDPDTDTLYTVEGNTSDAVHQRSYSPASSMSEVAGYIEPNGPNAPKAGEAAASGTVGEIASRIAEAIESAKGASGNTGISSAIEAALAMENMTETGDTEAINALINEYDPSWPLDCSTTPWCAAFASSILNEYGVMDFSNCENTNYCPSLQSWAEGEGTWRVNDGSYTPEAGSMVLFNWDGGEVDHVGIVTGYDPDTDTLYTVEGNTSDAVHQRSYSPASSMSEVAGYIEPNGPNAGAADEAGTVNMLGEVASHISEVLESVGGVNSASQTGIASAIEAALGMEDMTETGDTEAINALINEYDPSWPLDCSTTPWCAAFASSILNEYGVMDFSNCENANYCPSLQSWAEGEGTWRVNDGSYAPEAGSMVLFNWDGGDVDHVGIVTGYDPDTDTLYTIEGNTSDAVHQRSYSPASSMSEVAGYIEPNGPNAGKGAENVAEGDAARLNEVSGEAGSEAAVTGLSDKRLFDLDQGQYDAMIVNAADKYGVDPNLVKAMISQESSFDCNATSGCGAQGLMQLMPATAESLGCANAYDPEQNIEAGTKYISQMLDKYNGDVSLALAAYNAGPGNVDKYGGIPPFTETQNYVTLVLGYYNDYIS